MNSTHIELNTISLVLFLYFILLVFYFNTSFSSFTLFFFISDHEFIVILFIEYYNSMFVDFCEKSKSIFFFKIQHILEIISLSFSVDFYHSLILFFSQYHIIQNRYDRRRIYFRKKDNIILTIFDQD